jgi:hypothetical protein
MSVLLLAAILWIALSIALAVFLGRTVREAEERETGGAVPLSSRPSLGDAPSRFVDPTAGARPGSSRQS